MEEKETEDEISSYKPLQKQKTRGTKLSISSYLQWDAPIHFIDEHHGVARITILYRSNWNVDGYPERLLHIPTLECTETKQD